MPADRAFRAGVKTLLLGNVRNHSFPSIRDLLAILIPEKSTCRHVKGNIVLFDGRTRVTATEYGVDLQRRRVSVRATRRPITATVPDTSPPSRRHNTNQLNVSVTTSEVPI